MKQILTNWRYYLVYPLVAPFIFLEWVIFFECPHRMWDDSIWLHRILLWHDLLYRYIDGYWENKLKESDD